MIESANIFYVSNFNCIGGVETFIYELARKYSNYDITVIYKTGDLKQLQRLKEFVRVIKYENQLIKCDRAFFNYEMDIIDKIKAKEYIRIIHALYKTQNLIPNTHPKITRYLSVSEIAGKEWQEITDTKTELCRNPLQILDNEKQDVLYLISATRLTNEKGKGRMEELGRLLNKSGKPYIWFVFTNDTLKINNPNIVYMKPQLNIRPYIASIRGKGYGVQLSDCEGDCYFTRECEGLGVPLIVTPIESFKEQGLIESKNCHYVPFDMKNIDIDKIINEIPTYEPYFKADRWNKVLVNKKSTYKEEKAVKYLVEALDTYEENNIKDGELGYVPEKGERFRISKERLNVLLGENEYKKPFVKLVEEETKKLPKTKEEKAIKKRK